LPSTYSTHSDDDALRYMIVLSFSVHTMVMDVWSSFPLMTGGLHRWMVTVFFVTSESVQSHL
jgi:hypothetical protein